MYLLCICLYLANEVLVLLLLQRSRIFRGCSSASYEQFYSLLDQVCDWQSDSSLSRKRWKFTHFLQARSARYQHTVSWPYPRVFGNKVFCQSIL